MKNYDVMIDGKGPMNVMAENREQAIDMPAVVIPPRYFPDTRGREPRNYRNRSKYKPRIDTPKRERKGADNERA